GLQYSPKAEVLLEESILGWKEYELELVRDSSDDVIAVCSIENIDPVGVHTGDAITVAPAVTLTEPEYQKIRGIGVQIIRAVDVAAGGSNIQFAIDPDTGRVVVTDMSASVSRSSALPSKATGYPVAKPAARLAIGYELSEITNALTGQSLGGFEQSLDYVAVKVQRFA